MERTSVQESKSKHKGKLINDLLTNKEEGIFWSGKAQKQKDKQIKIK